MSFAVGEHENEIDIALLPLISPVHPPMEDNASAVNALMHFLWMSLGVSVRANGIYPIHMYTILWVRL